MGRLKFLTSTAVALLLSASLGWAQQPAGRGQQAPAGPRVTSPEVHADKKVTFRLLAPKASEVMLNGSWDNGADIPMTRDDQGIWSASVGPLGEQLCWYALMGSRCLIRTTRRLRAMAAATTTG
jgi:hypothetical protein